MRMQMLCKVLYNIYICINLYNFEFYSNKNYLQVECNTYKSERI